MLDLTPDVQLRRLNRQIAQHQARGVPAELLVELIAEAALLETVLMAQARVAWSPCVLEEC